ncbi:hypothetical protein ACFL2A_00795 [Thermodesulfobacteriota bacterium]
MKRVMIFLLVASQLLIFASSAISYQNEPDGFFDHKWGSNVESFKKQYKKVKLVKDGDIAWYLPNSGYARFSGVTVYTTYQFYHDELFFVNLYFDLGKGEKLEKAIRVSFGDPTVEEDKFKEWRGDKTGISFDYDKQLISFWSQKMMLRADLAAAAEADKAKEEKKK